MAESNVPVLNQVWESVAEPENRSSLTGFKPFSKKYVNKFQTLGMEGW